MDGFSEQIEGNQQFYLDIMGIAIYNMELWNIHKNTISNSKIMFETQCLGFHVRCKGSIIKTFQVGLCEHSQFNRYSEVFFWMIVGGSLNGPSLICFRLHLLMLFEYPKFIHLHPAKFLVAKSTMTDDLLKSPPVPCGHGPLALWTSHGFCIIGTLSCISTLCCGNS